MWYIMTILMTLVGTESASSKWPKYVGPALMVLPAVLFAAMRVIDPMLGMLGFLIFPVFWVGLGLLTGWAVTRRRTSKNGSGQSKL